jgi:DNA-binding transcriptional LysR family regulator
MIKFTLKQLEIFNAVAKHLSITKAAEHLHLSQPAVSKQIDNLKKSCGKSLIEQVGKKIYLTEYGERFSSYSLKIINQAELLIAEMTESDDVNGKISIGLTSSLQHIIFEVIKSFTDKYPDARFEFSIGNYSKQLTNIDQNIVDFSLTTSAHQKATLSCTPIINYTTHLTASKDNPIFLDKAITIDDILNESFIVGGKESESYLNTMELFNKHNKQPKLIVIDNQEAIKYAVLANLGVAFIPDFMTQSEMKDSSIIPINLKNSLVNQSNIYWLQNNHKYLSKTTAKFKTFLMDHLKSSGIQ